jgi:hypothetical protein
MPCFSMKRFVLSLASCLFILCASHVAHAQIGAGNLTLNIDNTQVLNGESSATGSSIATGTPLTGSVSVQGVSGNDGTTTVVCYENGNQIFSWSTSQNGQDTFSWTPSSAGTYILYCSGTWHGTEANGTVDTPNLTVPVATPPTGFINPKYVVVGVIYAPPGSSSYVQYTNTTSVGNTISIADSFSSGVGYSVSTSGTLGAASVSDGGVKLTATESTNYTQESSNTTSNTLTQASSVSYKISGTPTFAPVNSDYDYILLWLNPELIVTYTPPSGSNPASLQWNGYAFDPNDPASGQPPASGPYISGPDILEVQVGCLNGDLSCPSTLAWLNGVEGTGSYVTSGLLARSWQSAANGYTWPSGEVSGLTFNDVCQILTFDPLASTPSQCTKQNDYTLLSSFPTTTSDGRFTKAPYPPNVIQYPVGDPSELYSLTQTDTQSVSQGNLTQIQQAFSVSTEFGGSFLDLFSGTSTVKDSLTLTWNYSTLNTLTTTNTLTDALSITGPPDSPTYPGTEPSEFIAYQDNTFGTFVFVPVYQ